MRAFPCFGFVMTHLWLLPFLFFFFVYLLAQMLDMFYKMEMEFSSIEVVNMLVASTSLPEEFLNGFITHCIDICKTADDKQTQTRYVRLLCIFLNILFSNDVHVGKAPKCALLWHPWKLLLALCGYQWRGGGKVCAAARCVDSMSFHLVQTSVYVISMQWRTCLPRSCRFAWTTLKSQRPSIYTRI